MADQAEHHTSSPEPYTRSQVFAAITQAVDSGAPVPQEIRFYNGSAHISVDTIEERQAWEPIFGMPADHLSQQPHSLEAQPDAWTSWITNTWVEWNGWHVALNATVPLTNEHRRIWVEELNGNDRQAAHLAYLAEKAGEPA